MGERPRVRRALLLIVCACSHRAAVPPPARPQAVVARSQLTPDLVIARARGAVGIQRCYTRYLKHASGHGRVLVSFTVGADGHAQGGAAAGVPAKLGNCIVAEVARWQFPPPREPQAFAVPLDLIAD